MKRYTVREPESYPADHIWDLSLTPSQGSIPDILHALDDECLCVKCCTMRAELAAKDITWGGQLERLRDVRPAWGAVTFKQSQLDRALNLIAEYCYTVRSVTTFDGRWAIVCELRTRAGGEAS